MAPLHAQDIYAEPYYGTIELVVGFTPDPQVFDLQAGGSDDASVITGSEEGCRGYINFSKPDYNLVYQSGTYSLGIYAEAAVDTTMVVIDPAGYWYCNDDFSGVSSRNPGLVFSSPASGIYKIWIGVYSASDNGAAAQLHISEVARWQEEPGEEAGEETGEDTQTLQPSAAPGTTITSSGTGFYVSSLGHVITNNHVIEGCVRNTIQVKGDVPMEAVVLARNETVDLALLKTARTPMTFASFRRGRPVRQGEEIVVYGFPLSFELSSQGNITNGLVAALSGIGDTLDRLQISAPVQGGNSGGPVMDRSGNVVAVIVSGLSSQYFIQEGRDIPQNVNFAIPGSLTMAFLDTNNVDYVLAESDASLSIADIGERAQDFTGYILCYE